MIPSHVSLPFGLIDQMLDRCPACFSGLVTFWSREGGTTKYCPDSACRSRRSDQRERVSKTE